VKFYIMTDLEGPAGVNRWAQTREGETPEKAAAMRLLTAEVNAAVDGIRDADPDAQIVVWDGHGAGGGLVFDGLHPDVTVILHGKGMGAPHHLDATFDALLFVGQHAMAGTLDAPLCHTYSSRTISHYKLNGKLVGEIGCVAAMAGSMNVPVIFLSGDDKACAEASDLIPRIVTVATKQGLGVELALHLSAERARREIRAGAERGVRSLPDIVPVVTRPPYELEIRVLEGCGIGTYLERGMERIDARTVLKRSPDVIGLFR
jgi:D-amino peptidase